LWFVSPEIEQFLAPLNTLNYLMCDMCDRLVSNMPQLSVKLSVQELKALLELVDNQLFRMKFIDSRIPGHIANPQQVALATAAIGTLKKTYNKAMGITALAKAV